MFSFAILGIFTASTGVMLPPLTKHYSLTDIQVSTLFLVIPLGYILSASANSLVHYKFGQRGVAVLGPLLQIVSAVVVALHPRQFAFLVVGWGIMSMGAGLIDGSWCTFAAGMGDKANRVSGLLHGSFSVGAATGPFVMAGLMAKGIDWWIWYWIMVGMSALQLIILVIAFRHSDASAYQQASPSPSSSILTPPTKPASSRAMFAHPALWISALYFLTYVGNETAISGWIVSFMTRARHATPYLSNISSSGYWGGMAVGRLVLGPVTDRIGARTGALVYLSCAILLQLLFAFIHSSAVSVVLMTLLGFSMGPLFPSGVVVLTQLLPQEMHVKAVSFVSSLGQVGGAALPFGIGAVVQSLGIGVFSWVLLVFSSVSLGIWCLLAGLQPKVDQEERNIDYIAEGLRDTGRWWRE
ncbi:MFS general substrate transporter [Periconia macrospinosa]|uniref:MFS general substrate transporter n=1 Tax=Periconia macrospinosa TaxID=97972 RepID=A0A2V1D3W6_9PLEO|nr:MFS general substrate transporter [Periconia macrospinosa]